MVYLPHMQVTDLDAASLFVSFIYLYILYILYVGCAGYKLQRVLQSVVQG